MKVALYIIAALLVVFAIWLGFEVADWVHVFRRMS